MLAVQVSSRKKVFVSFCDDTIPNKGGFYCQVYEDEGLECEIDNFVIHNYELRTEKDYNAKIKKAYKIANERAKQRFA